MQEKNGSSGTLGTFAGVFTPSILTILGIILFRRMGYVVGSAGLLNALVIIAIANLISLLTTFSLAAIATNIKVRGGGDYYLISRTLGIEFGGAIGIVLYLAQSVSIAFYCIGFGEAVTAMTGITSGLAVQLIALAAVAFLFVFAWLGADWATRFQYLVMALLFLALLSFFWGGIQTFDPSIAKAGLLPGKNAPEFWVLFAIFFPAVTGFTQGVSMSGDLKDPGRSLPGGTFAAVLLSLAVYIAVAVVMAGATAKDVLTADYASMNRIAGSSLLINAGVIAATLSSAMASFMGAPRILQSLSADKIFPHLDFFAKGSGETNNPRRGVLLSLAIALAAIGLGQLNLIASVVSMFFLISYGLLNYATFYEAQAASPSFRPRFRLFDKRLSLAGALFCLVAMLAIDLNAGLAALAIIFGIHQYIKVRAPRPRWSDSSRSHHLQQVRDSLIAAAGEPEHPRDWRPQILAFAPDQEHLRQLLTFAGWISGGSGITTAVRILEGSGVRMLKEKSTAEAELKDEIAREKLKAFPLVVVTPDAREAVNLLVQSYGIGPLAANTVLANWVGPESLDVLGVGSDRYTASMRTAFRLGCNILALDVNAAEWQGLTQIKKRRIDIWWCGCASSRLALLLAYLMTRSSDWHDARLRLLVPPLDNATGGNQELAQMLDDIRIEAEIINVDDNRKIVDLSRDAALVFMPFRLHVNQLVDYYGNPLVEVLPRLPLTALVLAAADIDLEAEPEEGAEAEKARIADELEQIRKRHALAEKELEQVRNRKAEFEKTAPADTDDDTVRAEFDKELSAVAAEEEQAVRKLAKEKARLDDALAGAQQAGIIAAEDRPEP